MYVRDPNLIPSPETPCFKHVPLYSHLFPFPPFLTSFQPPSSPSAREETKGFLLSLARTRDPSYPIPSRRVRRREPAGRQAGRDRPDRTGPVQAGRQVSFILSSPSPPTRELQSCRGGGRPVDRLAWLVGGVVPRRPAAARRHDNMIDAPSKWFLLSLSSSPFSPSSPLTLFLDLIRGLRWPHSLEAELAFVGR